MVMDDDTDRYWMHSTGSAKSSKPLAPLTTMSRAQAALDRSSWIKNCAQRVLSSYRRDDFADADGYAVQLAMVFERYGDKIIEAATSPATGIQRTCKFPPSIAEVVEFINEQIRRSGFAANYDAHSRKQLDEREKYERQGKDETLEHRLVVASRIKGDLRAKGFVFEGDGKPQQQTWQRFSPDELLAKYSPSD